MPAPSTTTITRTRSSARKPRNHPRITTVRTIQATPRPKRRNRRQQRNPFTAMNPLMKGYADTLRDPFSYPGVRIGFGTMVPTMLGTLYNRFTVPCAADGTIAFFLQPSAANGVWVNGVGGVTTVFTAFGWQNSTAIQALGTEARVISGGLRIIPQVAATAAPGIAYAGLFPSATTNTFNTLPMNYWIGAPNATMGFANTGVSATIRPVDPTSFAFLGSNMTGLSPTTYSPSSTVAVYMSGLPAGTICVVEAVMNLEIIQSAANNATVVGYDQNTNDQPTLADAFPSLDAVWSTVKQHLPSALNINSGFATAANTIGHVARAASAARYLRSSYFANQGDRSLSRTNRVMIEEL